MNENKAPLDSIREGRNELKVLFRTVYLHLPTEKTIIWYHEKNSIDFICNLICGCTNDTCAKAGSHQTDARVSALMRPGCHITCLYCTNIPRIHVISFISVPAWTRFTSVSSASSVVNKCITARQLLSMQFYIIRWQTTYIPLETSRKIRRRSETDHSTNLWNRVAPFK